MDALLREQTLIFERAPIGIAFLRDRIIQRCNPSFERIFGSLPGQLIGQSTRVCFASEPAWSAAGERAHARYRTKAGASSARSSTARPMARRSGAR
jgi:PAS domain S-box-containing protein